MALLLPTGIATALFATRIEHVYISIAIVTGLGMCLLNVICLTLIGTMFKGRQRNICYSLLYVGQGATGIIYQYFLPWLVSSFGLMGTFLILGGIFSHVWVLPTLIQCTKELNSTKSGNESSVSGVNRNTKIEINKNSVNTIASDMTHGIEKKHEALDDGPENHVRLSDSCSSHKSTKKGNICIISSKCIDSDLVADLKRVLFAQNVLNVTAYGLLMAISNFHKSSQLDIAHWKGFSKEDGLNSFVILNGMTIFAGFVPGLMKLIPRCSISFLFVALSIISMSAHVLVIFTSTKILYSVANGLVGFAMGGVLTTANIALKISPKDLVSVSAGFMVTMNGLLTVSLGPILGYIRDLTGSYEPVLYTAVGLHVVVTSLFVFSFCCRKKNTDENQLTVDICKEHSATHTTDEFQYGCQSITHL
ncbi:hypothetical protein DPMN_119521 [Dreissena polymorpha]|uniref:Uncharacterized protein n=1 Tax=Dreissena polymorpha TaxID=45954 RepID=A0A9D4GIC3_DREPO|nr:hypothetical protein DPMN_119521 [Dreissena polymorpha]